MTKPSQAPKRDIAAAVDAIEMPTMNWKAVGLIAGVFAILWATALLLRPIAGWWIVAVVGALTLAAIGFGLYLYRLIRKQGDIARVMKMAGTSEGRKAALAELGKDESDAMKTMARAQLLSQEDPKEALRVMETIDIEKAPSLLQDDLRANRAFMYLMNGRIKEARALADNIRLDRQPNPKAKAMYAAVCAEAFARTGKPEEAKKLLETFPATEPAYGEVSALLYRAQTFTYFQTKNRGMARKAMTALAAIDVNQLAHVAQSGTPEMQKAAREVLAETGQLPKIRMQVQR